MVNLDHDRLLENITGFALDMDGTIYLDDIWVDGAEEFLKKIDSSGRKYIFLTNNSSKSTEVYIEKLARMGLDVDKKQVVTSAIATIDYLKKNYNNKSVFLLGNEILKKEFLKEGIILEEENPDVIVTAFDTSLDYKKMCKVCDLVRKGLPYIGTHPDYNCPTKNGFIPDIGAIHSFVHASTNRYPDKIIGKPNKEIYDYAMGVLESKPDQTAMIGDRLYTDIKGGVKNGLTGIFVLSGEGQLEDLEASEVKPDLIFKSVKEIIEFL